MDPGTIVSIVQLSASVLKLGSKISHEFFGNDRIPEKLRLLNTRLQLFNGFLEEILRESAASGTPSRFDYPGTESIIKTLTDCKKFLDHYETTLSAKSRFGGAAQRIWLLTGPDSSRLEDFHKRIDQHYTELQHWTMRALHRDFAGLRSSIPTRAPIPILEASNNEILQASSTNDTSLQFSCQSTLIPELPAEIPIVHASSLPNKSPGLGPPSRTPSIASIPELPQSAFPARGQSYFFSPNSPYHKSPTSGPVAQLLSRGHDTATINLYIGKRGPWGFTFKNYKVSDLDEMRVVEWSGDGVRIKHFISRGTRGIPFTKHKDNKLEVSFLPREAKHQFEITDETTTEVIQDRPRYQFDHKTDREIFQRRVRSREYLEMIHVVRIHREGERNIAIGVHCKVWRRDALDNEPTFSFAALEKGQANHHVEYKIRWFKKTPELKGDNKVVLRVYSPESDLDYGPQPHEPEKRSLTIGLVVRRMSGSPNQPTQSRLPSVSAPPLMLYEFKGMKPPDDARDLGYLEFEFENSKLRENFLNACFEAHHPGSRTWRRNTSMSESISSSSMHSTPSQPASWTSSSNQTLHEVMGDTGIHATPPTSTRPWPSQEVHFNTLSPFALPQPAIHELEALEMSKVDNDVHEPP
ncbi:hypothetical protein F5B20DRAFT_591904 [Whalleya microplaca]|nr:hypothetical protein F5B20DRAFT_591904 [Whalleya microplaca]